ncbi:MAG TPA: tRNA (adenosine(37)-N6)-dimethylallyltransferase MiaA [Ignavibacteriaceae bacterium]|nr:tRNA (adenosine(37)-N6)-dimethylallyltransferase MiaA [Ignavibacteriaceae bacterium]
MERKVIVIVGPTCSGKTDLSLLLAEKLHSEIISADSRQVYKYLNIGTAKPSPEELKKVKHHFIDELEPDEKFDVSIFENRSIQIINSLHKKNKVPIVVGGSGLYIKALIDGITETIITSDELRNSLKEERERFGNEYLYDKLKKIDPKSADSMLPQNWKRVIRAIEVFELTGRPIWEHHQNYDRDIDVEFVQFGLKPDREVLYKNIDNRVDEMINLGLVNEVDEVLKMDYDKNVNALNTVGYKEIIAHLEGEYSLERAIELIKRNTRRYAKRQLTWFNADKRIHWLSLESKKDLFILAENILKSI